MSSGFMGAPVIAPLKRAERDALCDQRISSGYVDDGCSRT